MLVAILYVLSYFHRGMCVCATNVERGDQTASTWSNIFENKRNVGAMLKQSLNEVRFVQHGHNIFQQVSTLLKGPFKQSQHLLQQMLGECWSKYWDRLNAGPLGVTKENTGKIVCCKTFTNKISFQESSTYLLGKYLPQVLFYIFICARVTVVYPVCVEKSSHYSTTNARK